MVRQLAWARACRNILVESMVAPSVLFGHSTSLVNNRSFAKTASFRAVFSRYSSSVKTSRDDGVRAFMRSKPLRGKSWIPETFAILCCSQTQPQINF